MDVEDNNKSKLTAKQEVFLLVQRAKKGDEIAFSELMERYRMSVYYLILRMVNNKDDAEDLTLEVFSKVYFNISMYAETHSFSTWLFKIASNHSIDFIRRKKNKKKPINIDHPLKDDTNWYFELASEEPNPEKQLMIKQKVKAIKDVIEILPEEIKIVIKLRVYEEMPYKDIAKILDVAIGTVKARLFRGRNILAKLINQNLRLK